MLNAQQKAFARHRVAKQVAAHEGRETMTDIEWARAMGINEGTMKYYAGLSEVKAMIDAELRDALESKDFFKAVLRRVALEELWVNYDHAEGPERRQYLSMILAQTADAEEITEQVDYTDMTDEDLVNVIMKRDVSQWAMTEKELVARLKMEGTWKQESSSGSSASPQASESASLPPNEPSIEAGTPETSSESPQESPPSRPKRPKKSRSASRSSGTSTRNAPRADSMPLTPTDPHYGVASEACTRRNATPKTCKRCIGNGDCRFGKTEKEYEALVALMTGG